MVGIEFGSIRVCWVVLVGAGWIELNSSYYCTVRHEQAFTFEAHDIVRYEERFEGPPRPCYKYVFSADAILFPVY